MSRSETPVAAGNEGRTWVDPELDRWMRHEAAAVHARLIQKFGWGLAELAEDAVQNALVRAMETWPFKGVPDRPGAWLYRVAANSVLDSLRSAATRRGIPLDEALSVELSAPDNTSVVSREELSDPELEVLMALCHPALPARAGIALTLQVLCGFTLREIESALLTKSDAVAQTLSRAKKTLRQIPDIAVIPSGEALRERLAVALDVIALIFNEGFEPSSGNQAMRSDLCAEAVRLADALARHPVTAGPEAHALAALLNLLFARLPARLAPDGAVTLLPEQNRAAWSQVHLRRGMDHLRASAGGNRLSRYHLLAGIAGTHAAAPSLEETDWQTIIAAYRLLIAMEDSPVHRLNFAIALQRGGDARSAGEEIDRLEPLPQMQRYFWFHVTRAEIEGRLGHLDRSLAALFVAREQAKSPAQAEIVRLRIATLEGDQSSRCA